MPENKKIFPSPAGDDQSKISETCLKAKALRETARARTDADNATSQGLVLFGAPKEAIKIFHESEMTNTEEVNKGIYFSYPCRRHSCAVVNIPAPCVNKMIAHIEDVESKIQEYLKRFETSFEEWSKTSSMKGLKEDRSITTPVAEVNPEERRDKTCPELKQEMETLLSEAIHLIKSLETDRAEAEEALKQQRSRKILLNTTIDSWSIWKLQQLPLAVQKEHEAYLRDFIELRWHLEDKVNQLKHFEEQKTQLEETNAKIQADIDFMSEHIPLLKSKQDQELEALKEIYTQKREVTEIFDQIHDELEEASDACKNAKLRAKQNKEEMDKDIHGDEINLEIYKRELEKLTNLCSHYSSSIHNVNTDIEEKEETVTEVMRETKSSKNELSALSKTLDDLRKTYDQLTWKKKIFEKQYVEALNTFYAAKKSWDIELSNVSKDYGDISIAYTQVTEDNKKLMMDLDAVTIQISDSVKKKTQFESEIKSFTRRKAVNDNVLKQLYKEAYHIGAIFHLTKHKSDELETKVAEVRRKFKGREEFLKKFTRGKVATGMMIQKNLYSIHEAQLLERQELVKQKAIYDLAMAEIEAPMRQLEEEGARIGRIHQEQSDALNKIMERKKNVKIQVKKTKKKLQKKEKKTRHALIKTEDERSVIFHKLETAKSKTVICHEKIDELDEELRAQEERKRSFDQALEILKEKFVSMRFKKEQAQIVFDHYMQEKRNCEDRMLEDDQRFRMLLAIRQKTLDEIKLCELQRRLHKLWPEYFRLVVLFSQMRLANIQADSQESIQKILAVQEESSNLMQHVLDFFQTLTYDSCENDG
ncbi:coiled-coil domain-containing protein 178 [Lemur catta]|uniref:coiled-coil domain-containing protein 178 n=1 Tax=Lemur catta TaxID=9447 RepID=UPI001E26DF96|nr:coiled-coil domain-containing protein 178 [Lemur catta]